MNRNNIMDQMMNQGANMGMVGASAGASEKQSKGMGIGMICCAILAVCGIGFGVYGMMQSAKKDKQIFNLKAQLAGMGGGTVDFQSEFELIQFTNGGGWGTPAMSADTTVSIYSDGKVTFTNNYKASYAEESRISPEKYAALVEYVKENTGTVFVVDEEPSKFPMKLDENANVITIKKRNGEELTIRDEDAKDLKAFSKMQKKILEAIDEEAFHSYTSAVHKLDS